MEASVVLAKCQCSKDLYGMRIEKRNNDWVRTWAFKISEEKARREGYKKTRISGSMMETPEYPGCPYCGSRSFVKCSCGNLFCWDGRASIVVCPWYGYKGEVGAPVDRMEVEGGGL